jgi:hypothetical protein
VKNKITAHISNQVIIEAKGVIAPALKFTALLEKVPETGKP